MGKTPDNIDTLRDNYVKAQEHFYEKVRSIYTHLEDVLKSPSNLKIVDRLPVAADPFVCTPSNDIYWACEGTDPLTESVHSKIYPLLAGFSHSGQNEVTLDELVVPFFEKFNYVTFGDRIPLTLVKKIEQLEEDFNSLKKTRQLYLSALDQKYVWYENYLAFSSNLFSNVVLVIQLVIIGSLVCLTTPFLFPGVSGAWSMLLFPTIALLLLHLPRLVCPLKTFKEKISEIDNPVRKEAGEEETRTHCQRSAKTNAPPQADKPPASNATTASLPAYHSSLLSNAPEARERLNPTIGGSTQLPISP